MNFIEALKSGKRFKRLAWETKIHGLPFHWVSPDCTGFSFSKQDFIADDWFIEEEPIKITRTEFLDKYARAMKYDPDPLPCGTPKLARLLVCLGWAE